MHPPYEDALVEVAVRKNAAVAGEVVLSADTIGLLDGVLLRKPDSLAEAQMLWQHMNGRSHDVLTAVCVNGNTKVARTQVTMQVPASVAKAYLDSGQWEGKAGGYGIQDTDIAPYITIDGPWSNVVGLPLQATYELLHDTGVHPTKPPTEQQLLDQNPFE